MYRCCACRTQLTWMQGMQAAGWSPTRCAACGVEQHRTDNRALWLIALNLATVAFLAASFLLAVRGHVAAAILVVATPVAAIAAHEAWRLRRGGPPVPSTPASKRLDRWAFGVFLTVALLFLAWLEFSR
jgi:hypothetical protein